jgi:glycosyltransferase involved in cell wall biosynthesis
MANRKIDNSHTLRILIINGDLPVFPGWGGIEYLHTTNLAQMAQKVGLVSLVQTIEQDSKKKGLADAGVNLFLWENPTMGLSHTGRGKKQNLFRRFAKLFYQHFRAWPPRPQDTLNKDFQFCNMSAPLLKAINSDKWHVLVVVQSSCAHWLNHLPPFTTRVLVMHDVRALMYERRAQSAESFSQRLSYKFQAILYRHYEQAYCRKYDMVVAVSQADKAWLQKHYQVKKLITIPIPVDSQYFAPMPEVPVKKNRIVFTGMMNHPPNVDAAIYFARRVFPKVKAEVPSAEFWIVGRDPVPEVKKLADIDGIEVTGFVPDIRQYIAQANVLVVPIRFGAGMRQKILEAWAMGKCVISTQIGAEGIDYQDNVNVLIADDAETMAAKVVEVIQNPNLSERISIQGRNIVVSKHNPDILSEKYYNALESAALEKFKQSNPMKVLIDLRWMLPGLAGGIENLSRSFINCLLRIDRFNDYSILLPTQIKYDFDLRGHTNFSLYLSDGPRHFYRKVVRRSICLLHQFFKVFYWHSSDVEKLNCSTGINSEVALSIPGYIHPELFPMANVLIVPDIQHEYHPEFFSEEDLKNRKRLYSESIQRADYICTISNFTRQTLLERYGLSADRVITTHLAADPIFQPENRTPGNKERVLKKYDLPNQGYLFFPANTWPHKNHNLAIRSLQILGQEYGLDPLLVCTGTTKEAQGDLKELIQKLDLELKVIFLGYCPVEDLIGLYEGAAALVYPSVFEGFGIPLLEAMWCDCPIICSNTTSLPEIAGDAAILVDPDSPEEFAYNTSRILTDSALSQKLIQSGRLQAMKFSWTKFTYNVVRILYQARMNRYR